MKDNNAIIINDDNSTELFNAITINPRIFNLTNVYFLEDVHYCEVSDYDDTDYEQFGAILQDGEWVIPAYLRFNVLPGDVVNIFYIENNGVELSFVHMENLVICIEFTELGQMCFRESQKYHRPFEIIVQDVLDEND